MQVWIQSPFDNLPDEGYRPQRFWLMARAFVAAGHTVTYWTSDFSHATKARRVVVQSHPEPITVIQVPTLPYYTNVSLRRVRSHRVYAKTWEQLAQAQVAEGKLARPDLIICAMPPVSTALAALRLREAWHCRVVVDIQDAWPETFYRLVPHPWQWLARLALHSLRNDARRAYHAADLVSGVCERYAQLAQASGAKEYYRAYLGIELPPPYTHAPNPYLRLVYLGNLGRSYDLATVIKGVKQMPEVSLDIAGAGPCEHALRRLASDCIRIRFHGYLNQNDLQRLLCQADIGIIPMESTSFVGLPNKLNDYAAASLRIVSSLTGETETLLREFKCGTTYTPGDTASFIAAVNAARELDPQAARRLAEARLDAQHIYADYVRHVTQ